MLLIFIKLYTSYCFLFILFRVLILLVIKLISQTKMSESQDKSFTWIRKVSNRRYQKLDFQPLLLW